MRLSSSICRIHTAFHFLKASLRASQSGLFGGTKTADILHSLGLVCLSDVKFSELDLNNPVRPLGQGSLRDAL
jgi:hypothetical protein